MSLNLLAWRRNAKTRQRTNRGAVDRTQRLRLESLEDRAVPATFNVTTTFDVIDPADGKRSLREAITAANNLAGADTIVLPAGVLKLAIAGAGDNMNGSGDLDIVGSLTIRGAGKGLTFIDGQQLDRVFDVAGTAPSSIKVVIERLTVRNGDVTGPGGGILFGNADLVVRDSVVSGNRAMLDGGGISNGSLPGTGDVKVVRTTVARNVAGGHSGGINATGTSTLTVTDSTVRRNVAGGVGGGIVASTATLTNSTLSGNRGNFGGGISASTLTLTNSTVSGNSADFLGGGILAGGTATLTGCTISGNSAGTSGGGMNAVTATLTGCTVSGNSAGSSGGGMIMTNMVMTNTTVSGNSAQDEGGGIWAPTATLLNCTIVENIAHIGGGLFHEPGGTFNIRNTIVALNLVDFTGVGPDVFGAFTSGGHNLIGDGAGGTGFTNGDIVGTSTNSIDPKLGPLQNNGGKTKTHALLAGSRAIDRGDNAGVPPTDQRGAGFPRKKDGNFDGITIVDIGAFER